ncbi:MAG: KOW motif domain-containing protein [Bdellovibrionota bacterium]|nr:50S ribosomal protein L24 [Pseudobdellovibrionaceae bacterium]MEC9281849.1 KOW motif domain-containing protein [Bdellovibrionota bacterium]|tara:strand:+ start:4236 stop:4520 length:285 start_codon:yes stop_codon:yes gene_type:complete
MLKTKAKKLKVNQGATVEVISGADKGKKGAVLLLDDKKLKVKVQGVNMQTHYDKQEGLVRKEGFIDYSNVKLSSAPVAKKKATKKKKKAATKKA